MTDRSLRFALLLAGSALLAACGQPQRLGTNVRFACATPAVDTTGWRRVAGPFPGYTILAPSSLQATPGTGRDVLWEDAARSVRVFRRAWGAAQFHDSNVRNADYNSCWTRIGGMRTYVVVRRVSNGYQVTGWYRRSASLPDSAGRLDGVVSGAGRAPEDQDVFLRMIRSLEPAN